MSEETNHTDAGDVQQAHVREKSGISMVWLLPAIAVLLGGWLLFKAITGRGIPITVTFETADGLEAGKTVVRYRDVRVGVVDQIHVAQSRDHVVVDIVVDRDDEDMLSKKTQFWVVRPRATLQGISGLGTLLSGAYIDMDPGKDAVADGQRSFEGLETPPVLDRDTPGARFVLKAASAGSLSIGSPVTYRGIGVGEVTKYTLDDDSQGVTVEIFVKDPHHKLVLVSSRFWNASGIDVTAGADGLQIETSSLEAMLIGGLEFDCPAKHGAARAAADGATFKLYTNRRAVDLDTPDAELFVCYFEESLRGLAVKAPVEFRGIEIGHVEAIDVFRDPADGVLHLPVTISVQPSKFDVPATFGAAEHKHATDVAIQRGLRAKLGRGSLITGALFVEMVIDASQPPRLVGSPGSDLRELPTISGGLAALQATAERILMKVDAVMTTVEELPLHELVQNASDAAASIDRLASSPDLENTIKRAGEVLDDLEPAIADLRALMQDADSGMKTAVDELKLTTEHLRETLTQADKTLASLDESVGPDSATQVELTRALSETSRAARSLRELSSYLKRHPEALLRGKSTTGGE